MNILHFLYFSLFVLLLILLRHGILLYKWNSPVFLISLSEKDIKVLFFFVFSQEMNAPSFRVEKNEDGSMHLHYYSDRRGLCHIVPGNQIECRVQVSW